MFEINEMNKVGNIFQTHEEFVVTSTTVSMLKKNIISRWKKNEQN